MKILFFGVNGYLGRHLYLSLKGEYDILPLSRSEKSVDNLSNYVSVDISNSKDLSKIDFNVDYVFLFSGLTGTLNGFNQYQSFIQANEIGLLNILDQIRNSSKKPKLIFPSTRLVFKGVQGKLLKEEDSKEPKTIYAQNKLACENFLKMYADMYGLDYTVYRICVPFGNLLDSNYSFGTIGYFLSKAESGQNISLYGDGSQRRTFTHISSLVEKIKESFHLSETKSGIFNIGGLNYSLNEAAKIIAHHNSVDVEYADWPSEAKKIESGDTVFDSSKLDEILGNNKYLDFNTLFD